ncbi:MAG: hypothetical protein AAFU55_11380, partial [Pseudomonadota bacterium]
MLHAPIKQSDPFAPPRSEIATRPRTAFWECQGRSDVAGAFDVANAPEALRSLPDDVSLLSERGDWTPYDAAAKGGGGPLIGVFEARRQQSEAAHVGEALMAQFAAEGAAAAAFAPGSLNDDGVFGGAALRQRETVLPHAIRARLAAGETIHHQGDVWLHGDADAAIARAAGDLKHPSLAKYAERVAALRAFKRAQFGAPRA